MERDARRRRLNAYFLGNARPANQLARDAPPREQEPDLPLPPGPGGEDPPHAACEEAASPAEEASAPAEAIECLICREEFPPSKMCADLPGSAGRLIRGCQHPYCVRCVCALGAENRRCSLCDRNMEDVYVHTCRKGTWALLVEAGGAGRMRFARLEETYGYGESTGIIEAGGRGDIKPACLRTVLKQLPCYDPIGLAREQIPHVLGFGATWTPMFASQADPETDMFVCTSRELLAQSAIKVSLVAMGRWEGSPTSETYQMKLYRTGSGHGVLCGVLHPNLTALRGSAPTPARLVMACEEFIHRQGWMPVD